MMSHALVGFYRLWHGMLRLKGAGFLLTKAAKWLKRLQNYPLDLPEGQRISVDFRDISAMYWLNHLVGNVFEERGLLLAIKPFLRDDSVVWDIGANSGLLAYQLARMNGRMELHLFEPNPRMFQLASAVVAPFENVIGHEFGLSNKDDELTLVVPSGHATMGTLEPGATGREGKEYKITCRAGDDLVNSHGYRPPDVIKIDTEGHEVAVISGIQKVIASYRPVIFFEHITSNVEKIKSLLPPGYQVFGVSDSSGELMEKIGGPESHNSVLVPE